MNKSEAFKDINKQSFYMFFKNDYFKSIIQKIQLFLFKIFFFPTNLSIIYKNGKKVNRIHAYWFVMQPDINTRSLGIIPPEKDDSSHKKNNCMLNGT